MADKKRGNYTAEFRQKAADLVMASDIRTADIAKTLKVVPSTLNNWVAKRRRQLNSTAGNDQHVINTPAGNSHTTSRNNEIKKLRHEIERLRQERRVVKEAIILLTNSEF